MDFENIGNQFVAQYYQIFDSMDRENLLSMYHPEAFITFEGSKARGRDGIKELFETKIRFQAIKHSITTIDSHPTPENGIIILVIGQLKTDDDPPHDFSQLFYIRPTDNSLFIANDMFRLGIHNM